MAAHARDSEINEFYGGRERGERAVFVFICQCLRRKRHSCRLACLSLPLSDGSSVSQSEGDHERGFPSSSPFPPPPPSELAILFNCSPFYVSAICLSLRLSVSPLLFCVCQGQNGGNLSVVEAEKAPSSTSSRWYIFRHI